MDELYGDLENYNEVNVIEELRNENKQLKIKVEEYETAMGKLQKDYDKLALEFHNLQTNYSSLLKTARAEVERKTQTITQLNLANDMKVLQSLKSGHNRRPFNNRSRFQKDVQNENKTHNVDVRKAKYSKNDCKPIKDEGRSERYETSSVSTNISVPSSGKTKLNIIDKVVARVDACINKGELDKNTSQDNAKHEGTTNIHAKIIDTRKSVSSDVVPKFSSEDESESGNPTSHEIRSDIPPVGSSVTNHINTTITRVTHDSLSTKTSETSSIDGRSSNIQDEARYNNRNRTSREHDKYKEWDRFRETDRTRDSGRLKVGDRYRESDKHKESDKCRVSDRYRESDRSRFFDKFSARDKHDPPYRHRKHSPNRAHKRSYREYQDDYYRQEYDRKKHELPPRHQYRHEDDRYKHNYEEIPVSKVDETNKRQKIETKIHFDQDKICHDNEASDYDMLRASCQSPDTQAHPTGTHTEAINTHIIKEIKNTAATPLEDPRVASKKYILKTDSAKPVLYTAISQSIDIKPVDKSLWNLKPIAVPDALLCQPTSNVTDDNLKDLISIENSHHNESFESGEICCDSDVANNDNVTELVTQKTLKDNMSKNVSQVASYQKFNEEHVEKIKTGYKIPKLKKGKQNSASQALDDLKDLLIDKTICPKQDTTIRHLNLPHIVPEDIKPTNELKKSCDYKNKVQQSQILSNMAMVQDDLELSDETSDYVDKVVSDEKTIDKVPQHVDAKLDDTSANANPHIEIIPEEICKSSELTNKQDDNKTKDYDGHKKHKSKRKKTKSKEIELSERIDTSTEKKKSKKDRESKSKEIKTTFSDLFGDSSSLITPEDLGMPASCIPLCEDVQEAMDINIKDIIKSPISGTDTEKVCISSEVSDERTHDTDVYNLNIKEKNIDKADQKIICPDPPTPEPILKSTQLDTNLVNQNLYHDVSDKPNVVKTVIISSGVQPQLVLCQGNTEKRVADVEVNIQKIVNSNHTAEKTDINKESSKALATSTPYKDLSTNAEAHSVTDNCLSDSNYSNSESTDRIASSASQLVTNTQSTYDPPDVRIFVKRRRKGVKRT